MSQEMSPFFQNTKWQDLALQRCAFLERFIDGNELPTGK